MKVLAILNANDYISLINITKVVFVRKTIVGFSDELKWVDVSAYSPTFFNVKKITE